MSTKSNPCRATLALSAVLMLRFSHTGIRSIPRSMACRTSDAKSSPRLPCHVFRFLSSGIQWHRLLVQWESVGFSGIQWDSVVFQFLSSTRSEQRLSGGTQWYSVVLSGTQWYSVVLSRTQWYSVVLSGTQWYSVVVVVVFSGIHCQAADLNDASAIHRLQRRQHALGGSSIRRRAQI